MALDDKNFFDKLLGEVKSLFKNPQTLAPTSNKNNSKIEMLSGKAGPFQSPVKGAKNYGSYDPSGHGSVGHVHQGIDMRAPGGTPIYPLASGVVSKVGPDPKGGNIIVIEHPGNYKSYYAHCSTISVKPGDKVSLDTKIATVGDSGSAKGAPHLHLQVWHNGSLIDPASLFSFEKQTVFNAKTEQTWLPGAKEIAQNFNIKDHLSQKPATTRIASRQAKINNKLDLYYSLINSQR